MSTTAVRQNDMVLGACSWVGSIGDLAVEIQLSPLLFTRTFLTLYGGRNMLETCWKE